jgi:uncharacterized protein
MNRMALAMRQSEDQGVDLVEIMLNGQRVVLDPDGALYLPDCRLLCVSDLHLEKGAAFARRGQMLPPWDTYATLKILASVIARHDPAIVVSLGDNFHDRRGSAEMETGFRAMVEVLARGREFLWVTGNHDPDGVTGLPGTSIDALTYGGLSFRHEPGKGTIAGEIAGHLHPAATLYRRERAVRRPCFASDGGRLIMPAFGVMTGGLDLRHAAFKGIFDQNSLSAHMLGKGRLYSMAFANLG